MKNKVTGFILFFLVSNLSVNSFAKEVLSPRVWEELGDLASAKGATLGERKELFVSYVMETQTLNLKKCGECLQETGWLFLRTTCEAPCVVSAKNPIDAEEDNQSEANSPSNLNPLNTIAGTVEIVIDGWVMKASLANAKICAECLKKTPATNMAKSCAGACAVTNSPRE